MLRYVGDGEGRGVEAEREGDDWWVARFPVESPVRSVSLAAHRRRARLRVAERERARPARHSRRGRFRLFDRPGRALVARGVRRLRDLSRTASPRAGSTSSRPDWAIPREWDSSPTGRGPETPFEWFGGDLRGVEQHLDHIEALGANVIYLTPVFPAGSTHRYDSTTFDSVDPLLGGDEALESLTRAAHARGMRVDLRPDDEPHRRQARVVRRRRAGALSVRRERRLRVVVGDQVAAEAELALARAASADPGGRAEVAAAAVRARRLARRRREHERPHRQQPTSTRDVAPTLREVLERRRDSRRGALPRLPARTSAAGTAS